MMNRLLKVVFFTGCVSHILLFLTWLWAGAFIIDDERLFNMAIHLFFIWFATNATLVIAGGVPLFVKEMLK